MPNVSYNTCCCDCTKINRARGIIYLNRSVDDYLKMTEYKFSSLLDNWLEELDAHCHFCNSKNVYGENIEIADTSLYDFNDIVEKQKQSSRIENLLILNFTISNGEIKREVGGKSDNEGDFVLNCWMKVVEAIGEISQKRFVKSYVDGQFFIVLTGDSEEIEIQSLKMCGFERGELLNLVGKFFMTIKFS